MSKFAVSIIMAGFILVLLWTGLAVRRSDIRFEEQKALYKECMATVKNSENARYLHCDFPK